MRDTRRYNVVLAIGFGSTAGLGLLAGSWIDAGATYPLKAAAFFAVLMAASGVIYPERERRILADSFQGRPIGRPNDLMAGLAFGVRSTG